MEGNGKRPTDIELSVLRGRILALQGIDLESMHGWLIGVSVAVERLRGVPYSHADELMAELRASKGPL